MTQRVTFARGHRRRGVLGLGAALGVAVAISGCSATGSPNAAAGDRHTPGARASQVAAPQVSAADIEANVRNGSEDVKVSRFVKVNVTDGTLKQVTVRSHKQVVAGQLAADGSSWRATQRLEPGRRYVVRGTAVDDKGLMKRYRSVFHTADLSLAEQTYPSVAPLDGSTVGVAMPVIIHFDVAVTDEAAIEKHLKVITQPHQVGAFHWISDHEVHWRPKHYWQPGTQVTVEANINSVPAGGGVYGQLDRTSHFTIGRDQVDKVNIRTDQLHVYRGGKLIRTIPVTTGAQPKYTTRSGVKVIVNKLRHTEMNSETIGIDPNSADGYDLNNVEYAMRLTYTGEFLHAAPWSVAYQGHSNVSHGCTGMSTSNAAWLFDNSLVGDPVEYTGSDHYMTLDNGYGDWNESLKEYK